MAGAPEVKTRFGCIHASQMKIVGHRFARAGFTLIELLAVIAVIAVLMIVVSRTISSSLEKARIASCAANLKSLGQALVLYASDHQARLPQFAENDTIWDETLLPYLNDNKQVFRCPSDPHVNRENLERHPRTYAVNGGQKYITSLNYPFGGFDGQGPLTLDQLHSRSGRVILIGERPGESVVNRGLVGEFAFCTLDQLPGVVHREQSGGNYLFSDTSVEYLDGSQAALSDTQDYWYVGNP